jgi:alpha-N-acetylglucosamine transferase
MILLNNMDDWFDLPHLRNNSKPVLYGSAFQDLACTFADITLEFNAGILVYRPTKQIYNDLMNLTWSGREWEFSDQVKIVFSGLSNISGNIRLLLQRCTPNIVLLTCYRGYFFEVLLGWVVQ